MLRLGRHLLHAGIFITLLLLAACSGSSGDNIGNGEVFDHSVVAAQTCVSCHDGVTDTGKTATHIMSTEVCVSCHNTTEWIPIAAVDHNEVLGSCASCHNGVLAIGKPGSHINTTNVCEACHSAISNSWSPVIQVDHSQVIGICEGCHNNTVASGKPLNHIPTTLACDLCHLIPPATWLDAPAFDHASVQEQSCIQSSCHDMDIPNDIMHTNTTDNCGACHSTASFVPATVVDHTEITMTVCENCHDGILARGKGVNHIITTSACDACHSSTNSWTVSKSNIDHSVFTGQACASAGCHDGVSSVSYKSDTHFNSSELCESCHLIPPNLWTDFYNIDHTQILGDCSSCHTVTINHISTSNQCNNCHSTAVWNPINQLDHTQIRGTCASCHDGITTTGKINGHIDTSDNCENCHYITSWRPLVTVDHNEINMVTLCDNCHVKPGSHPTTTNNCSACHQSFSNWNLVAVVHNEVSFGSCSSCHNGIIATGKGPNHILTNLECDVCHTSSAWLPARR